MRNGNEYGFNFELKASEKMGILRKFVKYHKDSKKTNTVDKNEGLNKVVDEICKSVNKSKKGKSYYPENRMSNGQKKRTKK